MIHRKTNPKLFYSHVNKAKKTKSKIGPLMNGQKDIISDPKEQATLMNEYFASVFTKTNDEPLPPRELTDGSSKLTDINITTDHVIEAIEKLKEYPAPGPDGIPPKVNKELKMELVKPITILFQKSMDAGKSPDNWREANVTPLFIKRQEIRPG